MQLLADNEFSPALPERAFQVIQPELAAGVAGELESPGYHAERAIETALFPKSDPIQRETTPEQHQGALDQGCDEIIITRRFART